MLRSIRNNIQSWFLKLILIGVALTFISWGAGYFSGGEQAAETKVVATVEGMPITWGEYQDAYRRKLDTYRKLFKDRLDEAMIQRLNLSDQVLDELIDSKLLLAIAREEGFSVSDAEVVRYIEGHPAFQVGDHFNRNRYLARLKNLGTTPASYEESVRLLLLLEQVQEAFKDSIHATHAEIRTAYKIQEEQVSTTFLLLTGGDFAKDVSVTEEALDTFYQEHRKDSTVPERRQVAYIVFRPDMYEKEVTLDQDRLKEYYELHIDKYQSPERVRARHILLKVPPDASAEEDAGVKARIEALLQEARGGKDFAELAKAHSQGPSADRGGDLGFFSRGMMVKPFEEAALALEIGQVGGPVKTPFGYHLIKVEAKEPASVRPYEDVEDEVRKVLVAEEARYLAQDAAYAVQEAIQASTQEGAAALSGREGLPVATTPLFARDEPLTDLRPDDEALRTAAFGLKEGEVSNVIEGERNSYIIALVKREPEHVPPLEAVKDEVKAAYRRLQGRQRAVAEAESLASSVKNVDGLVLAARRLNLSNSPTSTGWFTRKGPVPKVGADPAYIRTAFSLSPGAFAALPTAEGAYVLTATSVKEATEEGFASARTALANQLRIGKANALYAAWIQRLRLARNVEVDPNFFPNYPLAKDREP